MPILGIVASQITGRLNPYWIGYIAGGATAASQSDSTNGVVVDSSGNIYLTGFTKNSSNFTIAFVAKYNSSGVIQWQRTLTDGNATPVDKGFSIALDSSANVYVGGTAKNTSGGTNAFIAKYNTSGTIQWQRSISDAQAAGTQQDFIYGVATDSSSNVYVTGKERETSGSVYKNFIAKYNTSGTIQWQRTLSTATSSFEAGYSIAVDSSANVYVAGATDYLLYTAAHIAKYNTSGVIQWQRILYSAATNPSDEAYAIAVDSSANVYVAGRRDNAAVQGYIGFIAKYNTSGTIQWQRTVTSALSSAWQYTFIQGIALDSSANVYAIATDQNAAAGSNFGTFIFKYNSSGTIQWQRRMIDSNATPDNNRLSAIAIDSNNYMYVAGSFKNTSGGFNALIGKLPNDGSKTGTLTIDASHVIVYGTPSYTDAAGTATDAAGTATDAAGALTDAAGALTDASSSLTNAKVSV
jgi:hypothetical protein